MKISIAASLSVMAALGLATAAPTTAAPHVPGDSVTEETGRWFGVPTTIMGHKRPVPNRQGSARETMLEHDVPSGEVPSKNGPAAGELYTADDVKENMENNAVNMGTAPPEAPNPEDKNKSVGAGVNVGNLGAGASAGTDGLRVGVGREGWSAEKRGGCKSGERKSGRKSGKNEIPVSRPKFVPGREPKLDPIPEPLAHPHSPKPRPEAKERPRPQGETRVQAGEESQDEEGSQSKNKSGEFEDGIVEKAAEGAAETVGEKIVEEAVEREEREKGRG